MFFIWLIWIGTPKSKVASKKFWSLGPPFFTGDNVARHCFAVRWWTQEAEGIIRFVTFSFFFFSSFWNFCSSWWKRELNKRHFLEEKQSRGYIIDCSLLSLLVSKSVEYTVFVSGSIFISMNLEGEKSEKHALISQRNRRSSTFHVQWIIRVSKTSFANLLFHLELKVIKYLVLYTTNAIIDYAAFTWSERRTKVAAALQYFATTIAERQQKRNKIQLKVIFENLLPESFKKDYRNPTNGRPKIQIWDKIDWRLKCQVTLF